MCVYTSSKWETIPFDMCTHLRLESACTATQSDQRIHCPHEKNPASLAIQNAPSKESDQTVEMHMLIWIFAGHTFSDIVALYL